jgi:glutathione S-transferase
MTYRLFYAPGAASLCVHCLLVELGVPHALEPVQLGEASAEYRRLNPFGRVPTLVIDREPVSESAAILMLLAERYPDAGFMGPGSDIGRAKWMEAHLYLSTTLATAFRDWFYADKDGDPAGAEAVRALAKTRIEAVWTDLDAKLSDGRPYLLGETISTVDLQALMLMRWSRNMERPATSWPNLSPYIDRLRARPAFQETCRREGLTEWLG